MDTAHNSLPWWEHSDAFFYSYDSEGQVGDNSDSLLTFIGNVYPTPKWKALGTDGNLAARKYDDLILVGHSEGGVLIRNAILRRLQQLESRKVKRQALERDPILAANLRLFSPAFWGSIDFRLP